MMEIIWMPIKTAPKDRTRILLYDKFMREQDFAIFVGWWSPDEEVWVSVPGGYRKKPTHWAKITHPLDPLPE